MKSTIFIINGSGGVGKDTFVNLFKEEAERYGIKTENYSSITKVKSIAKDYFGWEGGKSENERKFLSNLKNFLSNYDDLPFYDMREMVETFKNFYGNHDAVLFLHIREPKEIKRAAKEFSETAEVKTILVKRDSVPLITSNMADANVFNYDYDITIENNSTIEALKALINVFVKDIYSEKYHLGEGIGLLYNAKDYQKNYQPKLECTHLILDVSSNAEACLNYAIEHQLDVKFTDTGGSNLADILLMFAQKGFKVTVMGKKTYAPGLKDKPIIYFSKN